MPTKRFKKNKALSYFYEILKIPRPSGEEEKIRKYLIDFAKSKKFKHRTDKVGNVAIDVPATKNFEKAPRTIVQAHMDMVCVGGNDRKATKPFIEDNWMKAEGTSLGADNGAGVAMAMAIAEDKEIVRGPLTILITVSEEEGMIGAKNLGREMIPKDTGFIFNMDAETGPRIICKGSAYGNHIDASLPLPSRLELEEKYKTFVISVRGLMGGHSGLEINKKKGNAIKILNKILLKINRKYPEYFLIKFKGGQRSNVIPTKAECMIAVPKQKMKSLKKLIAKFLSTTKRKLKENGKNLKIFGRGKRKNFHFAISQDKKKKFLSLMKNIPDGPLKTAEGEEEYVLLSNNTGIVKIKEKEAVFVFLARAAGEKDLRKLTKKIKKSLKKAGATKIKEHFFQGWEESLTSEAVRIASIAHKKIFKKDPFMFSYHAGLEVSEIQARLVKTGHKQIPSISIGPLIENAHSTRERLYIPSIKQSYKLLAKILEEISLIRKGRKSK